MHCFIFFGDCVKKKYLTSAFLLLITSVIVKVIGAVYKIPLTSFIGAVGRGYFATAYNIYMPVFVIIMGAFPIALSRLISQYSAANNGQMTASLIKGARRIFSVVGIVGTMLILLLAKPYATLIAGAPKSVYTVYILAPSLLLSCLACCYRGYFEGLMNMTPTAVSQLLEALFKLIFGIAFARYTMALLYREYLASGAVFGVAAADDEQAMSIIYPYTSAAAMLGVTLGALVSLVYLWVYYRIHRDRQLPRTSGKEGRRELLHFSFPIMVSCAVQSVFQFLDTASVQYSLNLVPSEVLKQHFAADFVIPQEDLVTYVYGIFSTALDFKNLVPGITMALGVSAVPALCREYEQHNRESLAYLMNAIYRYTAILSAYGGLLIYAFSKEILLLFYASSPDIVENCDAVVKYFGLSIPLYSLASTAVFCVQAVGKPEKSIVPYIISGVIRIVLNVILIRSQRYLLLGAVIAGAVGYAVLFFCNARIAGKIAKVKFDAVNILAKPAVISISTCFVLKIPLLSQISVPSPHFNVLIKMGLLSVIYYILCIIFKVIDFKEIFSALKSKKMA